MQGTEFIVTRTILFPSNRLPHAEIDADLKDWLIRGLEEFKATSFGSSNQASEDNAQES